MSRLDELAPDQSAVLSLLLRRGKRYAEVASLLGIEQRAVHDRAHAALAVLAPLEARDLDASERAEIGDYLLGQQSTAQATAARAQLERSASARAWAAAIAAALAPLSPDSLPEIPAADPVRATLAPAAPDGPPSSRRAGALLLAAIVVVVVAVVLITNSGGSSKSTGGTTAAATTGTSSTAAGTAAQPHVDKRFTMKAPAGTGSALGAAELLSQGSRRAFFLIAQGLAPTQGFFYVAWLYNSQASFSALGRGPAVSSNGSLRAVGSLPANTAQFHSLILTRETSAAATHPGPIVLSGSLG